MGSKKSKIFVIRIDPDRQTVAKIPFTVSPDSIPAVRRIVKAKDNVGFREIAQLHGRSILVAGELNQDRDVKEWRLLGGETHVGIGLLYSIKKDGGMVSAVCDVPWVRRHIQWLDAADKDPALVKAEADHIFPMLDTDIRHALINALELGSGTVFLRPEDREMWEAALGGGMSTKKSRGQELNEVGKLVRTMILEGVAA